MHISPTQVSTYRMCPRKWAWRKLDGIYAPSNRFAQLGSAVHGVLEGWLRDGTPLDPESTEGRIGMAGLQHLPEPGTGDVEREFRFTWGGVLYVGKIDWGRDHAAMVENLDHKTAGDLKWAKTPEDLETDEQAIIYGMEGLVRLPRADRVLNRWVYYRTKGAPKSKLVEVTLSRDHVQEQFALIHETALEMVALANSGKKALDIEPCAGACGAYGGCPYVDNCNLSSAERMGSIIAQHTLQEKVTMGQTLAEKMAAKAQAQEEAPAPAAEPEPPKATPAAKPRKINPPKADPTEAVAAKLGSMDDQVIVLVMTPAQLRAMLK